MGDDEGTAMGSHGDDDEDIQNMDLPLHACSLGDGDCAQRRNMSMMDPGALDNVENENDNGAVAREWMQQQVLQEPFEEVSDLESSECGDKKEEMGLYNDLGSRNDGGDNESNGDWGDDSEDSNVVEVVA